MIKISQVFFWKFFSRRKLTCTKTFLFADIYEGVYFQDPILWISDTNSAVLRAQFEKSQTKKTTFLRKKAVQFLILKIGPGKVTNLKK